MNQAATKPLRLTVAAGDGIGPEVVAAAVPVLSALSVPHTLTHTEIGWECWKRDGRAVPDETWRHIRDSDALLLGATTSLPLREAEQALPIALRGAGLRYVSPLIQLRQGLDLFVNVRPIWNLGARHEDFRCVILRENTEGLYAGYDYSPIPSDLRARLEKDAVSSLPSRENAACSIRLLTERGLTRLFRFAFEYAKKHRYAQVTFADKPNVLRQSGDFARRLLEKTASEFLDIAWDIQNVDAVGLGLVRKPEQYGVIVAENMFGDILSDVGAGVMGGLGLAPSANLGARHCYFEPVHGSAPRHAGKGRANPSAMFLTIGLLLEHFGFSAEAAKIGQAVVNVITQGRWVTYDLGGSASTTEMAQAIVDGVGGFRRKKRVALLATGSELTSGESLNTTSQKISQTLKKHGIHTAAHCTVGDDQRLIEEELRHLSSKYDAVIVTGGLGPTSDDRTRHALARVLDRPLEFHEESWNHVRRRLESFRLPVHESNRQQALFPKGGVVLENGLGTANAFAIEARGKTFILLPGPPRECGPLVDKYVLEMLRRAGFSSVRETHRFRLLGAVEADVAAEVDRLLEPSTEIETGYRWSYPYLDVKLSGPSVPGNLLIEVERILRPFLVTRTESDASSLLRERITEHPAVMEIEDRATGGMLQSALVAPRTAEWVRFDQGSSRRKPAAVQVRLDGLEELWQGAPFQGTTRCGIEVIYRGKTHSSTTRIPFRGEEVRRFASEWACHRILAALGKEEVSDER